MQTSTRRYENVAIDKLIPYAKNARTHSNNQIEKIRASIREFGFVNPVLIDGDFNIIAGHGRVDAARAEGIKQVPCLFIEDMTEAQKRAYIIADNRLALDAGWDNEILKVELQELRGFDFDISLTGFDMDEINILLDESADIEEDDFDADTAFNEIDKPVTKRGDTYQLGNHRLMCGDSTNLENVVGLTQRQKIDVIFTDPPYNMAFNGRSGNFEVIKNDNLAIEDFNQFIDDFIGVVKAINPMTYYICCNWAFYGIMQLTLKPKACIVWAKNVFGLGQGYRHQHEFIIFDGFIDQSIKNESDLWQISKATKYIHPTQKPVELPARAIRNSSKENGTILDLFGGSGSTLIACEQTNRICYMMELDEKYCDVIIKRWETLTGQKAVLLNG